MTYTLKCLLALGVIFLVGCRPSKKESTKVDAETRSDTLVSIENDSVKLTIKLWGGSFVDFQDKVNKVNPFSWRETNGDTAINNPNNAILQGQYLSLGRWSFPTPGESKQGMPINGEPANNWWKLDPSKNGHELRISCEAPLDGYSIKRQILLSQTSPVFKVSETITNENSTARVTSVMQNLILVSPFLESTSVINSNAKSGYNQFLGVPNLDDFENQWPRTFIDTLKLSTTDVNNFTSRFRYLSSHIFFDSIGWFTVYNPRLRLLLGYAWKTNDYPWIHFRNEVNYGKPIVHAVSFGTTGLSDKFSFEKRLTTTFHTVKNFDFIDAKASLTKNWYCFLVNVPRGYEKTVEVVFSDHQVMLKMLTNTGIKEMKLSL